MADFGLAAQIGRGGGGMGGGVQPVDPMNRMTQLMQLEQMRQNMMLTREQAGRQQQLFEPQLQAARTAAEAGQIELGQKKTASETDKKLWDIFQTAEDPYNPDFIKGLRKSDPRVASSLEQLAAARTKATAEAVKSRVEGDKARFELNKSLSNFLVGIMPTVNDQNSYSIARRRFLENNPEQINAIPEEYTPENKQLFSSVLDRLRGFQVIRTKEGDDIVFDPVNRTSMLLTPEGPVPTQSPAGAAGGPEAAGGPAAPAAAAGGPAAAGGGATGLAANMLRQFEGFRERPYFDVNAYRTGYGSDTITRPDGTVEPVRPGMSITREDAERDLQRRLTTEFIPRAARAVGEENWSALPPPTQAALASVTYNYGSLPARVAQAVRTGDLNTIATAVEGLAGDNGGVNANRRMQEASVIRGVGMMPGGRNVPSMTLAPTVSAPGSVPMGPNALAPMPFVPVNAMAVPQQPAAAPVLAPGLAAAAPAAAVGLTPAQRASVARVGAETLARERSQAQVKREEQQTERTESQTRVGATLSKMAAVYDRLSNAGGIPDERREAGENIAAYLGSTTVGQMGGKALATRAQTERNQLASLTRVLISDMKKATGMSAQEINSIPELQLMLDAASNPTQSLQAVYQILNDLNDRYGSGKPIEFKSLAEEPSRSGGIPRGRRGAETPAQTAPAQAAPAQPSLAEFLAKAKPMNPQASEAELTDYYNRTYGGRR